MSPAVLILEPNPVAQAFLVEVIRGCFSGVGEVATARTADEAWAGLQQATRLGLRPRLLLVDLDAEAARGLRLLAQARESVDRLVVTTLDPDEDLLFAATRAGADGHLLKGSRREVLIEALQRIVRGHGSLSPALARRILDHFQPGEGDGPAAGGLDAQEAELLGLLSRGYTVKEVAVRTGLRPFLIAHRLHAVCRKLSGRPAAPALPA